MRVGDATGLGDRGLPPAGRGVLAQRWPTVGAAMRRYEENVAEEYTRVAYEAVEQGLIRLDERRRLARVAEEMGIREFDAQLLIACAVRQWAVDHRYEVRPSREAPKLSYEYKAWSRAWLKFGIVAGAAAAIDGVILWGWLGR